jgi:hydroxyacylglutathione hydrolase
MALPTIIPLALGPMLNFVYLIVDPTAGVCAAVDPGWEPKAVVEAAHKAGCHIDMILLTHGHYDHAQRAAELVALTGAPVYVHEADRQGLPKGLAKVQPTRDGTELHLGSLTIHCLHTPGHTPGSQCFQVGQELLTGDTLFVDECGRDDLPGSSPEQMLRSLDRLYHLDPAIRIHPGHNYGPTTTDTIGHQRVTNPYLKPLHKP